MLHSKDRMTTSRTCFLRTSSRQKYRFHPPVWTFRCWRDPNNLNSLRSRTSRRKPTAALARCHTTTSTVKMIPRDQFWTWPPGVSLSVWNGRKIRLMTACAAMIASSLISQTSRSLSAKNQFSSSISCKRKINNSLSHKWCSKGTKCAMDSSVAAQYSDLRSCVLS